MSKLAYHADPGYMCPKLAECNFIGKKLVKTVEIKIEFAYDETWIMK